MLKELFFTVFLVISATTPAICMPATGTVEVHFSPNGGATATIVHKIASANEEILVQAYSFTSVKISKALVQAHQRGVKVIVVLDKSQRGAKYSGATFLANAGISVYIDAMHVIAHNKIMIIDRRSVVTGSFNFTKAAEEKNAENLLVMEGNKPLMQEYLRNFEEHRRHSEPYVGR